MVYREKSPYSGQFDHMNGSTCFGYVVDVDESLRRARVKTLGKPGITDDLDLANVQWISLSLHPQGDDASVMPRIGAYCVILFINSEPYIIGYYRPLVDDSITEAPNVTPLLPGDQGLTTIAQNSIVARAGGSIELTATQLCRILLLPSGNLVNLIGENYELDVDGGVETFTADPDTGAVNRDIYVFDNYDTTENAVEVQMGTTDTDAIMHYTNGPTNSDGEMTSTNMDIQIMPSGAMILTSGPTGSPLIMTTDPSGKFAVGTSKTELLQTIYNLIIALGKVQVLSPVGDCAPINVGDFWDEEVVPQLLLLQSITGTLSGS
jgi:hypothetical protein